MDYVKLNQEVWDKKVTDQDTWTCPVTTEEVNRARQGD